MKNDVNLYSVFFSFDFSIKSFDVLTTDKLQDFFPFLKCIFPETFYWANRIMNLGRMGDKNEIKIESKLHCYSNRAKDGNGKDTFAR